MSARSSCRAISAAVALAVIAVSAGSGATATTSLQIAGLYPGMRFEAFRLLHGEAAITGTTPVRYCYGRTLALPELSRLEATAALGHASLVVAFEQHHAEYRISTIRMREEVSFRPERIRRIRDALVQRFGPVDRILRRRKLEPAGLIVGFQWHVPGVALLTAKIHRDHAEDPERVYLTSTLVSTASGASPSRPSGRLPPCRRSGEQE